MILAAGKGSRLGDLTAERPKVLLEVLGETLLRHQRNALGAAGVTDVHLVVGHGASAVRIHPDAEGVTIWENPHYSTTNMVATVLCASDLFDGSTDLLVCYGDIVYEPGVVRALLRSDAPIAVAVDLAWREYWEARMDSPLSDAETLRRSVEGYITEVGNAPSGYEDIDGQYIGLIRVHASQLRYLLRMAVKLVKGDPNAFMTALLQAMIDDGQSVKSVEIAHQWLEFDTPRDLQLVSDGFWSHLAR